jgi:hypothetical protein
MAEKDQHERPAREFREADAVAVGILEAEIVNGFAEAQLHWCFLSAVFLESC